MIDSHAQVPPRGANVLLTGHMMTRPTLADYCLPLATLCRCLRVSWSAAELGAHLVSLPRRYRRRVDTPQPFRHR